MHLFCILGATASGKTAVSIALAKHLQEKYCKKVEIISLDSALVYTDMNIGTAKPSLQERDRIVHHLIDIITPMQNYNVGSFMQDVEIIVKNCQEKDIIPIIVGGTMLYYNALVHGLHKMPQQNLEIRQKINLEAQQNGWHTLHEKLKLIDEKTALNIKINDTQRIQRALEIYYISGNTPSEYYTKEKQSKYNLHSIAFIPERKILHLRIENRFNLMLKAGFVDEVKEILTKYPTINQDYPSMRCVGYRQCLEYLADKINFNELVEKGIAATRQLAKRQITWLKKADVNILSSYEYEKQLEFAKQQFYIYYEKSIRVK